jgi:hypothetical protein
MSYRKPWDSWRLFAMKILRTFLFPNVSREFEMR